MAKIKPPALWIAVPKGTPIASFGNKQWQAMRSATITEIQHNHRRTPAQEAALHNEKNGRS